jgi:hypothetical protein
LLAILPEFGLRVFQAPGGADFREWHDSFGQRASAQLRQLDEEVI